MTQRILIPWPLSLQYGKRSDVTYFSLQTGSNVHISTLITCRQLKYKRRGKPSKIGLNRVLSFRNKSNYML